MTLWPQLVCPSCHGELDASSGLACQSRLREIAVHTSAAYQHADLLPKSGHRKFPTIAAVNHGQGSTLVIYRYQECS